MSNDRTLTSKASIVISRLRSALAQLLVEYEDVPDATDADGQALFQEARNAIAAADRYSGETLPVERSAVSDARLQTMIDKPSGRDRHAALLELQRWRAGASQKAVPVDPRNCPQCGPHPNDSSEEHTRKAHTLAGLFNGSESEEV